MNYKCTWVENWKNVRGNPFLHSCWPSRPLGILTPATSSRHGLTYCTDDHWLPCTEALPYTEGRWPKLACFLLPTDTMATTHAIPRLPPSLTEQEEKKYPVPQNSHQDSFSVRSQLNSMRLSFPETKFFLTSLDKSESPSHHPYSPDF